MPPGFRPWIAAEHLGGEYPWPESVPHWGRAAAALLATPTPRGPFSDGMGAVRLWGAASSKMSRRNARSRLRADLDSLDPELRRRLARAYAAHWGRFESRGPGPLDAKLRELFEFICHGMDMDAEILGLARAGGPGQEMPRDLRLRAEALELRESAGPGHSRRGAPCL